MNTGPRKIGKYELQSSLGRGGMGEVWLAVDTHLKRYVAIKFLHPDLQNDPNFVARFEREAQAIAALHHPNIVKIYDFHLSQPPESEETLCYMVMDYVEGQTLASYIRTTSRAGNFPPAQEIVYLFTAIGRAIDYAHHQGMLHRDIKPSNILLDKRLTRTTGPGAPGEPVLSDFGIVRLLGTPSISLTSGWLGTPVYTSPEQLRGFAGNEQSDIYSLAVILYEICTGKVPFQSETTHATIMQQIHALPTPPAALNPNISPVLSSVILRGLAKEPTERFPNAMALADALQEAFSVSSPITLNQTEQAKQHTSGVLATPGPALQYSSSSEPRRPQSPSHPLGALTPRLPVTSGSEHYTQTVASGSEANDVTIRRQYVTPQPAPAPAAPQPAIPLPTPAPERPAKQRFRRRYIVFSLLLLLLILGTALGAFFLFGPKRTVATANQIVGHAFFISSGQINESSSQGITDELQMDLSNVPDPASGKSYYAWLEADKAMNMVPPILLGKLTVDHGQVHQLYAGDQQHSNMLAFGSRFLITEEDTALAPAIPSPDVSTWRYYAEFPQSTMPTSTDMSNGMSDLSVLDHLRHLLAEAPELKSIGLPGGLDIWLFRNTQKVLEWSGSARDDWQQKATGLMHRHFIRILEYLDGLPLVQTDVPAAPLLVDPLPAKLGLLNIDASRTDASYLDMMDKHLNAMIQTTDINANQRHLAIQIDSGIKHVLSWLDKVRQDARQVVTMSDSEVLQPSTLAILNDMTEQALNAFVGQIDSTTGNLQDGVLQIHYNDQRLATFDITAYKH